MLLKKNRADKKTFGIVLKKGSFVNSPNLTFRFLTGTNYPTPRISFVAPKSVSKKAVKRNLLRRRGYNILQKYIGQLPTGILGIFFFKKYQGDISILENEIKNILNKIN